MSAAAEEWPATEAVPATAGEPTPQPPEAKPLGALRRREANDASELLRHGYLCRGAGLLLVGPTGIGKSSLATQAQILWALGRDLFGICPARPLRSLLIQAENDEGDLSEMRDGIIAGLDLSTAQARRALENVIVACEDTRTSTAFTAFTLAPLLEKYHPDLLWIDPAFAYLGGEATQKEVTPFLRNMINPLLHRYLCGGVMVHHTNKPPSGQQKPDWQAGDFAYLGSGSAEWANWARAVLALRSIGSHSVFELHAGKRGGRIGWQDTDGAKSYVRYLAHAEEGICWREASPAELPQTGRPKRVDGGEMLDLLPGEGLTAGNWQKAAKTECGISEASFHRERRALEKAGRILKSKASGKWQPIQKA